MLDNSCHPILTELSEYEGKEFSILWAFYIETVLGKRAHFTDLSHPIAEANAALLWRTMDIERSLAIKFRN